MATTATTTAPGRSTDAASPRRPRRRLLVVLALVVAVLASGAVYGRGLLHRGPVPVRPAAIVVLPSMTLNLADGHLLQVTTALQTSTVTDQARLAARQPRLLDATLSTLGADTYTELLTPAGRASAKAALLAAFSQVLGSRPGPQLLAVYFTQFVMQ